MSIADLGLGSHIKTGIVSQIHEESLGEVEEMTELQRYVTIIILRATHRFSLSLSHELCPRNL